MDFRHVPQLTVPWISLAHFCENDGPTSVLCTQVLPIDCRQCGSASSMSSSLDSLDRDIDSQLARRASLALGLRAPPSGMKPTAGGRLTTPYRVGSNRDAGCASCTITLPETVRTRIPSGAPGSPRPDGTGRANGSPILRSKESIHACGLEESEEEYHHSDHHHHRSQHRSLSSSNSSLSDTSMSSAGSSCHTHTLEFVTTSSPLAPQIYASLRQASIRTLSCEQLPRGVACGPLFFGDPATGYVIAYKFRLPDPLARGQQRYYAFMASAGHDQGRAFEATSVVWKSFERLAAKMLSKSESARKKEKNRETHSKGATASGRTAAPHSFLTQRGLDPDGYPRRGGSGTTAGTMKARGLAEILGDDLVFAELHRGFVGLLQTLGRKYGAG